MPTRETDRARYLRKNMTLTEWRLRLKLRGRQLDGWKFRRQHRIGVYIVDFYCPAARLVIELDGTSHDDGPTDDYGQRRQAWLESRGYRVLRFRTDSHEPDYLEGVWEAIESELSTIAKPRFWSGSAPYLPASDVR